MAVEASFVYLALVIFVVLLILSVFFLQEAWAKRHQIYEHFPTISQFCAFHGSWGNRYLLALTSTAGFTLIFCHFEEFNSYGKDYNGKTIVFFIIAIFCLCFMPLIGWFYVVTPEGLKHENKWYTCGTLRIDIKYSTMIHTYSAYISLFGTAILNLVYSIADIIDENRSYNKNINGFDYLFFVLSLLVIFFAVLFVYIIVKDVKNDKGFVFSFISETLFVFSLVIVDLFQSIKRNKNIKWLQ